MSLRWIVAILAGGCLSKPALHVDAGHLDDGREGDVAVIDAAPAPGCIGRTPFPANLVLRHIATVGDLDRRSGADDIVVWGRESNGTGAAHVYLMSGHPEMTGTCYDERYDFLQAAVEPVDVWIGDTTGDAHPDLVMLGTEDGSQVTEIIVRAGDATTGLPSTPAASTTIPVDNRFQTPWGGTLTSWLPAFITAWQATPSTPGRIFAGGVYFNPASIQVSVSSGQPTLGPILAAEATGQTHLTELGVQDVYIHAGTPEQPIMLTQTELFRLSHNTDGGTIAEFDRLGMTALPGGSAQRGVRFAKRPIDGGSLGLEYDANSGLQAIQIIGTANEPAVFKQLEVPSNFPLDFAIASLDGNARPDIVVLKPDAAGVSQFLTVYPNFTLSPFHVDSAQTVAIPPGYHMLAVGDFDGNPATPDQILVLSGTISEIPAKCFELQPACLAVCGVGHC